LKYRCLPRGTARANLSPGSLPAGAFHVMSKAFEEALRVFAGDKRGREIIAARIIDLARNGLIDPTALRDRVIAEARLSE
jgi:hypothetical protein